MARTETDERRDIAADANGTKVANGALLHLAAFLPYRLNIVTQAVSQGLARIYAQDYDIAVPEWRIIATLGEFSEMTARDIAAHSRMGKVMTSRAAASLFKRRILAKRNNRDDRREAFLRLTPKGEAIYHSMAPRALAYQRRLTEGLSQADIAALERIVAHLMAKADCATLASGELEMNAQP